MLEFVPDTQQVIRSTLSSLSTSSSCPSLTDVLQTLTSTHNPSVLNHSQGSCKYSKSGNSAPFPSSDDHLQHSLKEGNCDTMMQTQKNRPTAAAVGNGWDQGTQNMRILGFLLAKQNASSVRAGFLGGFILCTSNIFLSPKIFTSYFFLESAERNISKHKDFSWGLRSASKIPTRSMQVFVKLQLQILGKTLKERVEHLYMTSETTLCSSSAKKFLGQQYQYLENHLTLDHITM